MIDNRRDDLVELPCDCEPHGPSFYLTLKPRSFAEAVRDVSRYRDLEPWVFDLLRPKAEVVSLADVRHKRRAGC